MSPRLASAITIRPAAVASAISRSSSAIPAEPCRSKKATCGLTTLTTPANASTHVAPKACSPLASSGSPHAVSNADDGSIPAHSGPVAAVAAATLSPKLSAITSSFVVRRHGRADTFPCFPRVTRRGRAPVGGCPPPWCRGSRTIAPPGSAPSTVPWDRGTWRSPPGRRRRRPGAAPPRRGPENTPPTPTIGSVGEGRPALPHRPYRDGVDGAAGEPAAAGTQHRPARLGVERQPEQCVDEGQPVGATLDRARGDLDEVGHVRAELGPARHATGRGLQDRGPSTPPNARTSGSGPPRWDSSR